MRIAWLLPGVKPDSCSLAVTPLLRGSHESVAVPVGSKASAALSGAAAPEVVDVGDGFEFEPQAATSAPTAAVTNRAELDFFVTAFTICC